MSSENTDKSAEITKEVKIHESILSKNELHAAQIKEHFTETKTLCLNIISSPGSGKTTLLEKTAAALKDKYSIGFLIGDIETERDADRIRKQGVQALQLTTGGACHLESSLIQRGIKLMEDENGKPFDILFIENVGNLVCPTSYDLGESIRVVLISTPEGDDKPAKYPMALRTSNVFIISKVDITEHFDFDIKKIKHEALSLNPYLEVIELSSKTGVGFDKWVELLEQSLKKVKG